MARRVHADRKAQIIQAALEVAAERGMAATTAQAIADRVGIAQPTVFRHFPTREAIFRAAVEWMGPRMFGAIAAVMEADAPAAERLRRLLQAQLGFISHHPGMVRILFSDHLHAADNTLKHLVRETLQGYTARVAQLIAEGADDGSFNAAVEPHQAAALVAATVQGVLMRWSISEFGFPLEKEVTPLWAFVRGALTASAEP